MNEGLITWFEKEIEKIESNEETQSSPVYQAARIQLVECLAKVKEAEKELKEEFGNCRDKTDIWDNERWGKFEKMFRMKIKEVFNGKAKEEGKW
jgi:hypothetical protein